MKLKLSFTIVALVSCLAILLAVVVNIPRSVQASTKMSSYHVSTPKITVSPTSIDGSMCKYVHTNNYVICPVTLSIKQPPKNGLVWTSSQKATLCIYNICKADYDVAVLPSQGLLSAGSTSVQVNIIASDYCYHGYANATFTFAIPGSVAKVKYSCTSGG